MKQYRHGDLFIQEIFSFPEDRLVKSWIENDEAILLMGEVTGHAHRLKGKFDLLRNKVNQVFLDIKETAQLVHEEHKTINLPVGKYAVIRQREYTPKEIVYVRD